MPTAAEIKMYTNNLFQDGDVLGGEEEEEHALESPAAVDAYIMQHNQGPFKGQIQTPVQALGSPKVRSSRACLSHLRT